MGGLTFITGGLTFFTGGLMEDSRTFFGDSPFFDNSIEMPYNDLVLEDLI